MASGVRTPVRRNTYLSLGVPRRGAGPGAVSLLRNPSESLRRGLLVAHAPCPPALAAPLPALRSRADPCPGRPSTGELKDTVLHARIAIGGTELAGADVPKAEPMRSAYLTLQTESDSEAERIFSALSAGGQVLMPMQETFFASRFGQVRDRFGINWMILHERPLAAK